MRRNGHARESTSLLPAPGGTRFIVLTFPPDTAMADPAFDPVAFDREQRTDSPGIADLIEPDGRCTRLAAGDIVIQNGTRHGWRNRSGRPVTMAFVLVGAERDG